MKSSRVAILCVSMLLPGLASAQMYRWVDERGAAHYAEGLDSVPERYRSQAQPLNFPKPSPAPVKQGGEAPASGTTKIPYTAGSPILVSAKINGEGPVTLVLDTGAERTMVSPLALSRLGISTATAPRGEIKGVGGAVEVAVVQLASVEVGEAKVGPLLVAAHDADLKGADGLLGRDFLDHFTVTIDSKEQLVTLAPK